MAPGRYGSDTDEGHADVGEPVRPEFPPARLAVAPAFLAALGNELGVQLLEVWGFLRSFPQARPAPARQETSAGLLRPCGGHKELCSWYALCLRILGKAQHAGLI